MGMPPYELLERTRLFALAVRAFCRTLPATDEAQEAARQLRRAANSVRSNYRASRKGRSRPTFEDKLAQALEEADECLDWLEYLRDSRLANNLALLDEANQLVAILTASVKTARSNSARAKQFPRS
jgi:four helix bundle protein